MDQNPSAQPPPTKKKNPWQSDIVTFAFKLGKGIKGYVSEAKQIR